MKSFINNLGIGRKFELILGISFLSIGLFVFFYFPQKQESEMTHALEEKANVMAEMVAQSSSTGLLFDEASSVNTLLEAFKSMDDVEFAVVLRSDGTIFSVFNKEKYELHSRQISESLSKKEKEYSDSDNVLKLFPVLSADQVLGNVVIGLNKSQIKSYVSSSRLSAFIISLVITVLGLFGIKLFFNKVVYTPIKNLTGIADKLALGDVEVTIESNKLDEIGKLEKSFISIINSTKEQSQIAENIANGELSKTANVKSEKDILSKSMNKMIDTLRSLINEVNSLTKYATEGRLSERGNSSSYHNGYREIVTGFNDTLNAITEPLKESAEVLNVMAQGDLTVKVRGNYKGDHQLMKTSINTVIDSLNSTLRDVNEAISATASASTQISSSSEEMAAGAQEQSAQTTEIASAMEEMTKTIMETTQNSSTAAQKSKDAGKIATSGGKVVEETVVGMNRIAEVVQESAKIVSELGRNSDQIGAIIQVIDDIADQTNLLALNAAIEAARAGEQGRGFAVVADEVRKLAERTTTATQEIADMIKKIQTDTGIAVKSIEQGTQEVEKGKELAKKAGESLLSIINGTDEVVMVVTQVAAASEEQSATSEQISRNIEGISRVTQESAMGVEQIARASEDLNRLTEDLQSLIQKFKIVKNENSYSVRANGSLVKR